MKVRFNYAIKKWWENLPEYPKLNWQISIIWLLIINWVAFLANLGSIGLVDETEPKFVEAARQMILTGDWITPYWNGETRFDKPPLVYWLMAIAFKILGVNEFAARLPSALAAIAITVSCFYTLRYFGFTRPAIVVENKTQPDHQKQRQLWISAWIGAAIIALNPVCIGWGRTGVSDMILASNISMAMLAFFIGYAQKERSEAGENGEKSPKSPLFSASVYYIAFYVFIALAILTKGPIGLVLPVLGIGSFLLYVGNFRQVLREMRPGLGCLIIFAIAVPWFVLVTLANGETYIDTFFGYHNLQRFTSVVNHHRGPWYFYFPVVLVELLPWSIYLPIAIARLRFWQQNRWKKTPRSTHLGLFAFFWFIAVFLFFTISVTKLPSYALPLIPAGAIMIALFWSDQMDFGLKDKKEENVPNKSKNHPGILISIIFNILFLLVLAIATFFSPKLMGDDPIMPQIRPLLQASGLPILGAIVWGSAAIASIFLLWQPQHRRWLWSTNLAGMMAFMIFVVSPAALLMDSQRQLPLRQISALVTEVRKPGEEIISVGFVRPSLTFYTRQNINYIESFQDAFTYIKQTVARKPNFSSVLVIIRGEKLNSAVLKGYQYQELGNSGVFRLVRLYRKG